MVVTSKRDMDHLTPTFSNWRTISKSIYQNKHLMLEKVIRANTTHIPKLAIYQSIEYRKTQKHLMEENGIRTKSYRHSQTT